MFQSLEFVKKDVAGVKDRIYKNSVYKLRRGSPPSAPAYLVAECATPLHTLRRVMDNRDLYEGYISLVQAGSVCDPKADVPRCSIRDELHDADC